MPKETKLCAYCGKPFYNPTKRVKTCSRKCGYALNRKRNAEKAKSLVPIGVIDRRPKGHEFDVPVIKECEICGAKYAIPQCKKDSYSTCSEKCSRILKKTKQRKHPDVERTCEICGTKYTTRFNGRKLKRAYFCSDECRLIALNQKERPRKDMYMSMARGYIRLTLNEGETRRHVFMHRYVMEKKIGRPLRDEERVHHINGNKTDNRPENLMLFPNHSEHIKYEFASGQRRVRKGVQRGKDGRFSG